MSRWFVTRGAWVMALMLVGCTMFIMLVRDEQTPFPSMTNVRPTGYAAFAELLRRDGYDVVLDRGPKPDFNGAGLVIAPFYSDTGWQAMMRARDEEGSEPLPPSPSAVRKYLEGGGTVLEIEASRVIETPSATKVASSRDPQKRLDVSTNSLMGLGSRLVPDASFYEMWSTPVNSTVGLTTIGKGRLVVSNQHAQFTNRYLDTLQNAEFGLTLVRSLAPQGGRIVFFEEGIGNAVAPSPTNTLGNWAVVARWQLVILAIVIAFGLSRRFGLPDNERRTVRSSRELFDAIADVLRRRRDTGLALRNVLQECDARLARALPSVGARSKNEILAMTPSPLAEQYRLVAEMVDGSANPSAAARAAARLFKLLHELESDTRTARSVKR